MEKATERKSSSTTRIKNVNNVFDTLINACTLTDILKSYIRLCQLLDLEADKLPLFYNKLKENLTTWKAVALWKKLDQKAQCESYGNGIICSDTKVLIIGAGPCGLRTAIEAQLLGAKVVVVEKRDKLSRNNILHLWPFVIEDLKNLGAKKFLGKFCAGSINHISIRQLQCILLKVCLLLGVEFHVNTTFEKLVLPDLQSGWRAQFKGENHPLSNYEFDVVIGAVGTKTNRLPFFKRNEFRGKLAIAITANFVNNKTELENMVGEISGVSRIYKPNFFNNLNNHTGIDLENIVYYKDDTHYFIMTAKKSSLLSKGVIKEDLHGAMQLLSAENINKDALLNYAMEAAQFSTDYQLQNLQFALNHYNQPDVAVFDFTCMHQAEHASRVIERNGCKLLCMLVGDGLLEPFWPTGSGCAKGFLSSLDTAWTIRGWGSGLMAPLEVLSERESIYRLLATSTPDNLNKDIKCYTIDPTTRYCNLNKNAILPEQIRNLYDDSNDDIYKVHTSKITKQTNLQGVSFNKDLTEKCNALLEWVREKLGKPFELDIVDIGSLNDSKIICAILYKYRPDLVNYNSTKIFDLDKNTINFAILEKQLGLLPLTPEETTRFENNLNLIYLYKIYQKYDNNNFDKEEMTINKKLKMPSKVKSSNFVTYGTCKRSFVDLHIKRSNLFKAFMKSLAIIDKATSKSSTIQTLTNAKIKSVKESRRDLSKTDSVWNHYKRKKKESVRKLNKSSSSDDKTAVFYIHQYLQKLRMLRTLMKKFYESNVKLPNIQKSVRFSNYSLSKISHPKSSSLKKSNTNNEVNVLVQKSISNHSIKSLRANFENTPNTINSAKEISIIYKSNFDLIPNSSSKDFDEEIVEKVRQNSLNVGPSTITSVTFDNYFTENVKELNVDVINLENVDSKSSEQLNNLDRENITEKSDVIATIQTQTKKSTHLIISKCPNKKRSKIQPSNPSNILIRSIERIKSKGTVFLTEIKYSKVSDRITITRPKINRNDLTKKNQEPQSIVNHNHRNNINDFNCQLFTDFNNKLEVSPLCIMSETKIVPPDRTFQLVNNWLKHCDFNCSTECSLIANDKNLIPIETNIQDKLTDITSITKEIERKQSNEKSSKTLKDNKRLTNLQQNKTESSESMKAFKKNLKKQTVCKKQVNNNNVSPWNIYYDRRKSRSEPSNPFATIVENEEIDKVNFSQSVLIKSSIQANEAGDQPEQTVKCHKKLKKHQPHQCKCKPQTKPKAVVLHPLITSKESQSDSTEFFPVLSSAACLFSGWMKFSCLF